MKKTWMLLCGFVFLGTMVFTQQQVKGQQESAQQLARMPIKSSIKVLFPGNGDYVWTGKKHVLHWERKGLQPGKVKIMLIKKGGGVERVITDETDNDGSYAWMVPYNLPGMQYKIRVKASPEVKDTGGLFTVRCCLKLDSISKTSGKPGDTFEMLGEFGPEQGEKVAVLNKGTSHVLTVVSWSHSKLVVKIPDDLEPGMYKTGVYCSNPCTGGAITTWCVLFRDFEVLSIKKLKRLGEGFRKVTP